MKKENISYSVMDIKKLLRMIRLCNLQYEKTMQFAAQQMSFAVSNYSLVRIRWRSCKVCCAKKHAIQCNIQKYLRKTKATLKDSNAICL